MAMTLGIRGMRRNKKKKKNNNCTEVPHCQAFDQQYYLVFFALDLDQQDQECLCAECSVSRQESLSDGELRHKLQESKDQQLETIARCSTCFLPALDVLYSARFGRRRSLDNQTTRTRLMSKSVRTNSKWIKPIHPESKGTPSPFESMIFRLVPGVVTISVDHR